MYMLILQFMSVSEGYRLSELKFSSFSFTVLARTCYFSSLQEFYFLNFIYLCGWRIVHFGACPKILHRVQILAALFAEL